MVTDAAKSMLYREQPVILKRKPPDNTCNVYFLNKVMKLIN